MTSANVSQIPNGMMLNTQAKSAAKSKVDSTDFMSMVNTSLQNSQTTDVSEHVSAPQKTETLNSYQTKGIPTENIPTDNISTENKTSLKMSTKEVDEIETAVEDFVQEVQKVISDEMDVSTEEIENAMTSLGLTLVDLTNPEDITKLLGELTEEGDVSLLLTDTVSNILTEVEPLVENLFETLEVETPKEFGELLTINDLEVSEFEIMKTPEILGPNGEVFGALEPKEEVLTNQILNSDPVIQAVESNQKAPQTTTEIETPVIAEAPLVSQKEKVETELENFDFEEVVEMETDKTIVSTTTADTSNTKQSFEQPTNSNQNNTSNDMMSHVVVSDTSVPSGVTFQSEQNVSFASQVEETFSSYTTIDVEDIMDQIVTQTRTVVADNSTTMELELHPASLGKMYLQVTENEGTISAKLYTQNHDVKAAMETQMLALKENWAQQGLKVNSVEISVGTREFEEQLEQQANTAFQNEQHQFAGEGKEDSPSSNRMRNINLNGVDELPEDLSEEELLAASMMKDSGNSVNFTA